MLHSSARNIRRIRMYYLTLAYCINIADKYDLNDLMLAYIPFGNRLC